MLKQAKLKYWKLLQKIEKMLSSNYWLPIWKNKYYLKKKQFLNLKTQTPVKFWTNKKNDQCPPCII